ncbi:MAG: DUF4492 domain-containing protein [Campylobacterota bacterium]|nr:DUF4492 domain-containing protein [Campylobacterota bacterium]
MINIKNIYLMYYEGFKNMTVGKTLWKIIFIKLAVILIFLKYVTHDRNFKSEYKTYDEKVTFVYENLKGN